jgi:hypothetical protein
VAKEHQGQLAIFVSQSSLFASEWIWPLPGLQYPVLFAPYQGFLILGASRCAPVWCGDAYPGIFLVRQGSFMSVAVRVITDISPFSFFGTLPAFPSGTEDFSVFSTTTFLFRGEQT